MIWKTCFIGQTNVFPVNTGENISGPQRPNSSPLFTGQRDVLDKLEVFFHCPPSDMVVRHSCLLWGMGGIGKTQICLKFIEEMFDRQVITVSFITLWIYF